MKNPYPINELIAESSQIYQEIHQIVAENQPKSPSSTTAIKCPSKCGLY